MTKAGWRGHGSLRGLIWTIVAVATLTVLYGVMPSPPVEAQAQVSGPPNSPVLFAPVNASTDATTSPTLDVSVTDPGGSDLTVTFYGRVAGTPGAPFRIIPLPDTQYYSSSQNGGTPAMFNAQTTWVANNKNNLNIAYLAHLGDIVQSANNNGNDTEWANADTAIKILENGGVAFGVHPGNHDMGANAGDTGNTPLTQSFNRWFGVDRFQGRAEYGGHYLTTNDNHYDLFSAGGMNFVVIYFAYDASPSGSRFQGVLTWANGILKQYADRKAILVSHYILNAGNPATFGAQGQALFDALKNNPNLFLLLSGHVHSPGQRTDTVNGNTIHSVMSDYQDFTNGGNGYLRIMTFTPATNQIQVQSYSPFLNQYMTDSVNQFTLTSNMQNSGYSRLGTATIHSGNRATVVWDSLVPGTQYEWYAVASNGSFATTGPTWSFTTAPVVGTRSISGTVSGVSGAAVALSGTSSGNATADASGNYSFSALTNGSYTVTPSKSGFTFTPTSAPVTVNDADVTGVNFTAAAIPTYSISGNVSASGSGATVTLSGAASKSATADASGNYSFTGLANGGYTVTPSKSGFTFSPVNRAATVNNANVTGVNFTAAAIPVGQSLFTTQVPSIANDRDGPSVNLELGLAFRSSAGGQITGIRFWKASNETGTHTGRLWSSTGTLLGSVVFTGETASGWQQQSLAAPIAIAANTTYVVSVNTGNAYYVDTPGGVSAQVVNGSLSSVVGNNGLYGSTGQFPTNSPTGSWAGSNYFRDVLFVPGATYSISGTAGLGAATVALSGAASRSATADALGNYSFAGLANGSYTVTPSKSGYTFSPASAPVTVSSGNVTGVNFTAAAIPTYTISGTAGVTGSGATVALSGTATGSTTADASGNYSFGGLANGSYTVTPSKSGFTFSPSSAPVTVSGGNVTANFTATAIPTYTISGTAGVSAATVALSGAASRSTTADASGNYSFTGLANGSYTVTPSKSGYTFSPANAPATVSNANVSGINFTASVLPASQSLFTTQVPSITNDTDGPTVNLELGMAFRSTTAGRITGIRFWKASNESGTHTGRIWSSAGVLLGSVVFSGETASGWQQQLLTTPIVIAANTTYIVSVNTGNSFYVDTPGGLTAQVVNGSLSSVVGSNGLYGPVGQRPTNTPPAGAWAGSNYFRDVVFAP